MKNKKATGGQTTNLLFSMLLFLVFVLCALFTVLVGGRVYENVSARMEENYTGSVALNYIANKVRQGDHVDAIEVKDMDGTSVLELSQVINGTEFVTWIYYYDGEIRELFTDPNDGLGLEDGLSIITSEGLQFEMTGQLLTIETAGENGGSLYLSVKSGGGTLHE